MYSEGSGQRVWFHSSAAAVVACGMKKARSWSYDEARKELSIMN